MKRLVFGPHGRLLFRSYLILAAALVVVATVLEFGFDRLQPAESLEQDPWLSATLDLIETELVAVTEDERDRRARELGESIGLGVHILRKDDVYMAAESQGTISTLTDADGNIIAINGDIQTISVVGPCPVTDCVLEEEP